MSKTQVEHADRDEAHDRWANRDPQDPYRWYLLEAVRADDGPEASLLLEQEIEQNP